jgi:hypothetical protein
LTRVLLPIFALLLLAAPAQAAERKMTLYSKAIDVPSYTGEQDYVPLATDDREAPADPGWITSLRVDVVKKRSASAKALSIQDVMIHHMVLSAQGAVWGRQPGVGCFDQFFARGEENQEIPKIGNYGLRNATADGRAPTWVLTHMLMNHRAYDLKVYVRTRLTYSDTPKTELTPLWFDTENCNPDPVFTVPGGGKKGSTYRDRETESVTVPSDGRIIGAQGHLHGGGKYQSLRDDTCGRELVRSRAYYGFPSNIFYRVRPILHEPSPIAMGRTISRRGIPVNEGDKLTLTAAYDNQLPHTRVMSIMMVYFLPGEVDGCEPMPDDVVTQDVPRRFRKPYPPFRLRLAFPPRGEFRPLTAPIGVGPDYSFSQRRVVVKRGTQVTWRFDGSTAHDVATVNGPRGFSSDWLSDGRTYEYTPRKTGTYSLYCSLHPGLMSQQLKVVK